MDETKSACKTASRILLAAAVVLITTVSAFGGQERHIPGSGKWEFGLTGGAAFPMGDFRNNLGKIGWSIDCFLGHRIGRSLFSCGFDFYFMNYGMRTHDEYLSGTIPVRVEVETDNNVIQGLFYLKCQPRRGRVRPFVEALAGVSYLYTSTGISGTEYPYADIASDTNFDDFTFCAGGGVGMDIHAGGSMWLNFKVRYLSGGRAQYLRPDSIVYDNDRGTFTYLFRESTTNLLSAQVGFSFVF